MKKYIGLIILFTIHYSSASDFSGTFEGKNTNGKKCTANLSINRDYTHAEYVPEILLKIKDTAFSDGYRISFLRYADRLEDMLSAIETGKPLSTVGSWFDYNDNKGSYSTSTWFNQTGRLLKIKITTNDNLNGNQNETCFF